MTTAPARRAAPADPAAVARPLDAIAAELAGSGTGCPVTRLAATPVLTTSPPAGPNAATVAIDPDTHAGPDLRLDCTCVWTLASGTTPQATAAVITAVLSAARPASPAPPPSADAARVALFLRRYPSWSAFWDPRYGLWRAAEDDPG
ncbi:MAG TPA: hypothetical protein VG123_31390, partial [Streptosporangiaceae bacterium]|nr:hypothetical protein [Streptosporangiaceae bacterium]